MSSGSNLCVGIRGLGAPQQIPAAHLANSMHQTVLWPAVLRVPFEFISKIQQALYLIDSAAYNLICRDDYE